MAKKIESKVEFIGKIDPAKVMKLLLDLEIAEDGLVPIAGTFKIWRDTNDTRTEKTPQTA